MTPDELAACREAQDDFEAQGEWQFADREARDRWFFAAALAHARQQSAEEIRQLKEQVEGLRKGAERYQYLRSSYRMAALHLQGPEAGVWCDCEDENGTLILLTEEDLDAAIDSAIAQEKGK